MDEEPPLEKRAAPPAADRVRIESVVDDRPMSGSAPGGLEQGLPARARIIAPTLLVPGEIVIFELKPSLLYVAFVSIPIAAAGLGLLALAFAAYELPTVLRQWGAFLGMTVAGLRVVIGFLQWLGRTYVLTDRRILVQAGVVNVEVQCMGLEDVENTFVAQAAAQRLLAIGTLFFRAVGPGCGSMAWEHISQPNKVHAEIIAQIDRWKRSQAGLKRT
jgi:hypothetical protein